MDNASPWQAMARATQAEARDIVAELDIEGHWRRAGAMVHAVGSFRTGLLIRHRDIDFHVYTPTLDRDLSFRAMAALASSPYLNSLHFVDGSATEEHCLEWHGIWQRPGGARCHAIPDSVLLLRCRPRSAGCSDRGNWPGPPWHGS